MAGLEEEPPAPEPMPVFRGVSRAQFRGWLHHHPVGKLYLAYLRDYRDKQEKQFLELVVRGVTDGKPEKLGELRGRMLAVHEISELPFEAIIDFYDEGEPEAEPKNQGEAREDGSEAP